MPATASSPHTRSTTAAPTLTGWPVGLAGHAHEPAHRLQQQVVAGQPGRALDEPKAVIEHDTSRGLRSRSVSPSSPQEAISPGRNDSISTSARAPSSRASSRSPRRRGRARPSACCGSGRGSRCSRRRATAGPRRGCRRRRRALDLDHVGAEVAERHRGERARQHAREVGDEEPVERGRWTRSSGRGALVSGGLATLVVSDLHLGSMKGSTCSAARSCARRCSRRSRAWSGS